MRDFSIEKERVEVRYFNKDCGDDGVLVKGSYVFWEAFYHIISENVAFRVIGDLNKWRKMVDDYWQYFKDDIRRYYDKPIVNSNEWFSYFGGKLMRTADVAEKIKELEDWFTDVLNERS